MATLLGQQDDEQIPDYYGAAARLMPQADPSAQQGGPVAVPSPRLAPQQPTVQEQMQQAQPQQSRVVLPTPPTPPTGRIPGYEQTMEQRKADAQPVDRKANAPKWWERLAGGAVGFGVGYKEGPTAGIRAGGAITTRRYDNAVSDQQTKVAADDASLQDQQRLIDLDHKNYEDQLSQFGGQMQVSNAQREQGNSDREFGRQTANDDRAQSNSDRSFGFEKQVHTDELGQRGTLNGFEDRRITETNRHNRADEANTRADIAERASKGREGTDKTTMTRAQFMGVVAKRDAEYDKARKDHQQALTLAVDDKDRAQINADYQGQLDSLQNRWNNELAAADPEGKYAPGKPAQGGAQPAQTAKAPTQQPPAKGGKPQQAAAQPKPLTDVNLARQYLQKAGGDKAKARQLAKNDGYTF